MGRREYELKFKSLPARINRVRKLIESAGNTIGSVHFKKRTDGEYRKMAYRLHVRNPSTALSPKGAVKKSHIDWRNLQMTVIDCNKPVKDSSGKIIGRGAWRTIPLEMVSRVAVKGKIYKISE